jgi:hypothetical protein
VRRGTRRAGVKYCEVSKYRVRSYDEERGARASARPGAGRRAGRARRPAPAPWPVGTTHAARARRGQHQRHTPAVRVITAPRPPPAGRPPPLLSFGRLARGAGPRAAGALTLSRALEPLVRVVSFAAVERRRSNGPPPLGVTRCARRDYTPHPSPDRFRTRPAVWARGDKML